MAETAPAPSGEPVDTQSETPPTSHQRNGTDPDAQAMVIASLRSQIQDLFTQVTQLNSKLVKSYDRVSDLEDDLHVASSNLRSSSVKISQLELERTQHLAALNTGLLVEKSHVTAELTRLMEKATEEAAQRGQAETAREDIEKELDDLSANLFDQANTMVAEARLARAISERKVEGAEAALKGAEEAVGLMQNQMQALQAEKEKAEKDAEEIRAVMGKGKWVDRISVENGDRTPSLRLLSSHPPYQEFLLFVAHLRSIRPASQHPPAMSTLLPLPFLARLLAEDSEPTVRLDLAPSLNWLSRRSVLSAIHNGQLTVEPMSSATLLRESSTSLYSAASLTSPMIPGTASQHTNISCALCGISIFNSAPDGPSSHQPPPTHPMSRISSGNYPGNNSWSSSLFKNPLNYTMTNSAHNSPPSTPPPQHTVYDHSTVSVPSQNSQIFIFRLSQPAPPSSSGGSMSITLPLTAQSSSSSSANHSPRQHTHAQNQSQSRSQATIYPLCSNGWCLTRLRATCSLWAFVRSGIVEKVWEEEVPTLPTSVLQKSSAKELKPGKENTAGTNGKPPVPPRRRGLWSMASALGERAASWSGDGDKERAKEKERSKTEDGPASPAHETENKLPQAPPTHPTLQKKTGPVHAVPPPLPKRSEGRGKRVVPPRAESPAPVTSEDVKVDEDKVRVNGDTKGDEQQAVEKMAEDRSGVSAALSNGAGGDGSGEVNKSADPSNPATDALLTSPPSESDGGVQDSFSTPTEELSDPISSSRLAPESSDPSAPSALSPSSIPLPESSANTPTASASFAQQQSTPSTKLIEPTGSRPATPVIIERKDVPSRTSSPAPPLPRRAAARARPLSHAAPPAGPRPAQEKPDASVNSISIPNGRDAQVSVSESDPTSQPENTQTEVVESPVETTAPEEKPADRSESVAPSVVNGTGVDEANGSSMTESEKASEVAPSPSYVNGETPKTNSSSPTPADSKEEMDNEVYIGDATWEERTWKELVKLKQDMFWARVGGLR